MDTFLADRLEDYLAGALTGEDLARFESLLRRDPEAAELAAALLEQHALFASIRIPEGEEAVPAPGFYARVNRLIEEEKTTPFWEVFLQPFLVRRLAFAALMWMLLLGTAAVFSDNTTRRNTQLADMILREQLPAHYQVRMGPNLDDNRASMLAVMLTPER